MEVPLLKQLYEKCSRQGLVLISVSIDEDLKVMQSVITRRAMTWPQIGDGKGPGTEIARLYGAGSGTHFVIDREGKIAGMHRGSDGVPGMARLAERLLTNR